jgi:hypothetical protein
LIADAFFSAAVAKEYFQRCSFSLQGIYCKLCAIVEVKAGIYKLRSCFLVAEVACGIKSGIQVKWSEDRDLMPQRLLRIKSGNK